MGWFDGKSREQEVAEEAHREGQKDGSEGASNVHTFMTSVAYSLTEGDAARDAYDAGVENGRDNPSDKK